MADGARCSAASGGLRMSPPLIARTADFAEHERERAWSGLIFGNVCNCLLEPLAPLDAEMSARQVGEAMAAEVRTTPVYMRHAVEHVEPEGAQIVMLQVVVEGTATYHEFGEQAVVCSAGDVMICDSAVGGEFLAEEDTRVVSVAAPRHLIVPRFATREAMRRRASRPERTLASRLLWELSVGLAREGASMSRRSSVVEAIGGLILLALDDPTDNGRPSSDGRAQARLAAIRDHLRRNAGDPNLSPAQVAETFAISRRYLHRLMAMGGRSFQDELLATRLANCMGFLRDPRHAGRTVAAIAYDCGFNDLSQFNRRFRERYGCTPREVRPAARRPGSAAAP